MLCVIVLHKEYLSLNLCNYGEFQVHIFWPGVLNDHRWCLQLLFVREEVRRYYLANSVK